MIATHRNLAEQQVQAHQWDGLNAEVYCQMLIAVQRWCAEPHVVVQGDWIIMDKDRTITVLDRDTFANLYRTF